MCTADMCLDSISDVAQVTLYLKHRRDGGGTRADRLSTEVRRAIGGTTPPIRRSKDQESMFEWQCQWSFSSEVIFALPSPRQKKVTRTTARCTPWVLSCSPTCRLTENLLWEAPNRTWKDAHLCPQRPSGWLWSLFNLVLPTGQQC